jgi:hypothetical protein
VFLQTRLEGDRMTKDDPERLTNKQMAILMILLESITGTPQFVAPLEAKYLVALDTVRKVRGRPPERQSRPKP